MKKARGFLFTAGLVLAMAFTFSCSSDDGDEGGGGGSVSYGGQKYKTVKIGEQTWMAENLNYAGEDPDNPIGRCYSDDQANCKKYGRLYNWSTALTICPEGWHLPSDADWTTLTNYVGSSTAGTKLKTKSGWDYNGNGTDDFGFSALPGGYYENGSFAFVGIYGYWWSATEYNSGYAHYRHMICSSSEVIRNDYLKSVLHSVRCVQD